MRVFVSAMCMVGALILIAASMFMNWSFWTGQGADPSTANVLGAVSIGIDVFKACLPLVIAWCWAGRSRLGYVVATLIFVGCFSFSFLSALGYAASTRGTVTGGREAVSLRYAAAEQELKEVKDRLAAIGATRPQSVIEEALSKATQDRRWSSSSQCKDATVEVSRAFCRDIGDLRIELASAAEAESLRTSASSLKTKIDRLVSDGARLEQDQQAALLSRLTGMRLERVQTSIVVLFALLVELGAAFGFFLATIPLKGRNQCVKVQDTTGSAVDILKPTLGPSPSMQSPTRFVRAPNGQLMIE